MGGWKQSGLGTRHGAEGIRKYCLQQATFVRRFAPARNAHMFPHRVLKTGWMMWLFRLLYGRG